MALEDKIMYSEKEEYVSLNGLKDFVKNGRERGFLGIQTAKGILDMIPYIPTNMFVKEVVFCGYCKHFQNYGSRTGKCDEFNAEVDYYDYCSRGVDKMTYEEALKELKHEIDMLPNEPPSDFVGNENVWFKEHEKIIDAHKIAIEAIEKQIPKKVIKKSEQFLNEDFYYRHIYYAFCPRCKRHLFSFFEGKRGLQTQGEQTDFCGNCGQALDWSE